MSMKGKNAQQRDRLLYDELVELFPPPPYLIQREIRPWLYQQVCSAPLEVIHTFRLVSRGWLIYQMHRLNWEKE
jgi:hypothetical protein